MRAPFFASGWAVVPLAAVLWGGVLSENHSCQIEKQLCSVANDHNAAKAIEPGKGTRIDFGSEQIRRNGKAVEPNEACRREAEDEGKVAACW